jgi:hypothetical protein
MFMDGEARMLPGRDELQALFADQLLALEEGEDLVGEELLRGVWIDVGEVDEAVVSGPSTPRDDGMNMGVGIDAVAEGLDDGDHAGLQVGLLDGGGHELADTVPGEAGQHPAQLAFAEEQGP